MVLRKKCYFSSRKGKNSKSKLYEKIILFSDLIFHENKYRTLQRVVLLFEPIQHGGAMPFWLLLHLS